jgi:hypothetical protein
LTIDGLIGKVDLSTCKPRGFQVGDQLSADTLLNKLIFKRFTGYQARATRILWDKHDLSFTTFAAIQGFVPVQTIDQLSPSTYDEIIVVRENLVNLLVETGELPLLFKLLTSSRRPWTMSRENVLRIEIRKNIFADVRRSLKERLRLTKRTSLKIAFRLNEVRDNSLLFRWGITDIEFVHGETHLSKMFYGINAGVFQENTVFREDTLKVFLHESGYTTRPFAVTKLLRSREA